MAEHPARAERGSVLPVLLGDLLPLRLPAGGAADILLNDAPVGGIEAGPGAPSLQPTLERQLFFRAPAFASGSVLRAVDRATGQDLDGSPATLLPPGLTGRIDRVAGRFVFGSVVEPAGKAVAADEVSVIAFVDLDAVAFAQARRTRPGGREFGFVLVLPTAVTEGRPAFVQLALAGGTGTLAGSPLSVGTREGRGPRPARRAARPLRMAIKIATPDLKQAQAWGDYHFARSLKGSLERLGWVVDIDTQDVWYREKTIDVDLVIRGRHRYTVNPDRINLMWIISHPDRLAPDEPADFDHVFVASDVYLAPFRTLHRVPSSTMHQATDPSLFFPAPERKVEHPLLFVGNSRREYRTMVRWCIEKSLPVAIWGGLWEGIVPPEMVRGINIPNETLGAYYGAAGVLLNDHWDTMRDNGFLSNRLFDGSAAGAFILTDPVKGLAEVFGDTIETVASAEELAEKARAALKDQKAAWARAMRAREIVLAHHTFDHRARTIVETVEALGGGRTVGTAA